MIVWAALAISYFPRNRRKFSARDQRYIDFTSGSPAPLRAQENSEPKWQRLLKTVEMRPESQLVGDLRGNPGWNCLATEETAGAVSHW